MNKMLIPILFALGTALFWGCYGPTIGNAQTPTGMDGRPLQPPEGWSPFKPYVFIGIAYLVVSVIGGLIMMKVRGDSFNFGGEHFPTVKWGFFAGCFGAFGAICLTTAMMTSRGNALLVLPIVFGGAICVMSIVSIVKLGGNAEISPMLWVGMAITVIGVVTTAMNVPHGHAAKKPASAAVTSEAVENPPADTASVAVTPAETEGAGRPETTRL